jgi:uncharacterized protein (TIGR02646 family)
MIRIKRSATVPATLNSRAAQTARDNIKQIAANGKPKSDEFRSLWGDRQVRQALWEMQSRKCAYCERLRDVNRESDIDHFRPKAEVTGAPGHKGYWWLAYQWTNLLFCCRHCNQTYKLNHFPVPDETRRVSSENQPLQEERAYLIDPCDGNDDPENCFMYFISQPMKQVYISARPDNEWNQERAGKTIRVLGLCRDELCDERGKCVDILWLLEEKIRTARVHLNSLKAIPFIEKERLDWAQQMFNEAANEIRDATHSSQSFAGFRRFFFRERGLGDYVSQD